MRLPAKGVAHGIFAEGARHFEGKDAIVEAIYALILAEARKFGPVFGDRKKASIHLSSTSRDADQACAFQEV